MVRRYRFTKKITKEQADLAIAELKSREKIRDVSITEDLGFLNVDTDEENYYSVMTDALNIFERIEPGCELSFSRFVDSI